MYKKNTIPIVYIVENQEYYTTTVSLQSLLDNNKNNLLIIYIAYDNTLNSEILINLKNQCKKYPNVIAFNTIFIDSEKYTHFKNNRQIFFQNKIYLADIVNNIKEYKFLYISSQVIVNADITELYNFLLDNHTCASIEYVDQKDIQTKYLTEGTVFYSNNVMLIDKNKWIKNNYGTKLLAANNLKNYSGNLAIPIWVYICTVIKDCKILPQKYEYSEEWWRTPDKPLHCSLETLKDYKKFYLHLETPQLLFIGNPTDIEHYICKNSYLNLWWKYAENTPLYEEIKNYKSANKYKLSSISSQNSFRYFQLVRRILPYIKPYIFRIILGFLIAIPLGLLDGVTAFALKPYMDYVVGGKIFELDISSIKITITSLQMAYLIPLGVIVFAIIQGVLRYLNGYLSSWVSMHITNDVKLNLFSRLIKMHPQFFDDNSSGIIISRYMGDPITASSGIVDNIKTITTSLFGALGLISVMLYCSPQLAFIGVIILCIAFIPVALIRNKIKEASDKSIIIGGNITTNINETYNGNKVMCAYGLQARQYQNFKQQVWREYNVGMSLYKRSGWMSPLMYLIASIGIAIVLGFGTYLIHNGNISAGSFASFVTSLLLLYKPVKTLGNTLTGIQNIFVAMSRIFELFDLEPAIADTENAKRLNGLNREITFEHVNFEYVPNKPVLKDINLKINKYETIAIVGNSGGGKSSLVNLIPRFYDIRSGEIKIDGINIKNYTLKSLRENISIVFQDNFLFSGTIKENILTGCPNADTNRLYNAIKSAHLEEMITALPDGLDTELGERGLTLSGGQRQRIAIARAILRDAPIVILDEATSALDNESEAIVQKAMENLIKNKTVLIIAHRLSTIKNADRIIVINEGKIVENGTHETLMQYPNGHYKHLYEVQFGNKICIKC